MKKIRFESENGRVIEFTQSPDAQYILENFDGNGLVSEANSIKIPDKDGKKTYNLTRSSRHIEMECAIISKGSSTKWMKQTIAENRDYVSQCFDPRYFGMLYYYSYIGDNGKKIRCRPTGLPAYEHDFNNLIKFKLGFDSDGAMWKKTEMLFAAFGMKLNNLRYPKFMGTPYAYAYIYSNAVLNNTTIYDIPPVVTIYNSVIPVEVTNITTGTFLKFKIPTGLNKRIVIDVENATAILEENINGTWEFTGNVIHYLTLDSRLTDFLIVPGENKFKVKTVEGDNPVLTITGHEFIMGV